MYLFISCKKNSHRWKGIREMCREVGIDDYVILCGSNRTSLSKGHVLYLNCPDDYAGLPTKMKVAFETCYRMFPGAKGFVKVDDDVKLVSGLVAKTLSSFPFAGCAINSTADQNGRWHMGRCPGSKWNVKQFDVKKWNKIHLGICKSVLYPSGGHVYYVDRSCCRLIAASKADPSTHIWEDAFVGAILAAEGIKVKCPTGVQLYSDNTVRLHDTKLFFVDQCFF